MVDKSRVKYINSLGDKKQRDADSVFVAEGPRIINDLLDESTIEVQEIFALTEWIKTRRNIQPRLVTEVDGKMLQRLSFLTTPNQVVGIFKMPSLPPLRVKNRLSLVADTIQDPGNLGTMIRCADWFGIDQVICSRNSADVFNPKVVQATMGSIARVKVYYEDLSNVLKGVPVYAATLDGRDVRSLQPVQEGAIVIGNESKGISDDVLKLPHEKITIVKNGRAESLNAAVATGIILSHLIK
ncbi:MAG: RNA methyltransferase [Chitinophagaceae bacterium]|nr:RNA methyltransferase [Chitinophagaceae bacterium]